MSVDYGTVQYCFSLGSPRLPLALQLRRRMKIAELKQICARPDVVEVSPHVF